jgi:hypothetical protein
MDPMVGRFIMEERNVSSYVLKMLGMDVPVARSVGAQTQLKVVRFLRKLYDKDKVTIVGRALKHIRGQHFVKNFKFCFDEVDGIVYILSDDMTLPPCIVLGILLLVQMVSVLMK